MDGTRGGGVSKKKSTPHHSMASMPASPRSAGLRVGIASVGMYGVFGGQMVGSNVF